MFVVQWTIYFTFFTPFLLIQDEALSSVELFCTPASSVPCEFPPKQMFSKSLNLVLLQLTVISS